MYFSCLFQKDLYQTAQMCETSDKEHVNLLYDYAQRCKGVRVCVLEGVSRRFLIDSIIFFVSLE